MKHKTISVSLPVDTAEEVESRAKRMPITVSMYIRILIENHIESKIKMVLKG